MAGQRIVVPAEVDAQAFAAMDRMGSIVKIAGETMGTTWRVLYASGSESGGNRGAVAAVVSSRLRAIEDELSHWKVDSPLSRFNRSPPGCGTMLPPDFRRVMEAAFDVADRSAGAFDPALGALVDLWGHGPPGPRPTPDADAVRAALDLSGFRRLAWDASRGALHQPGAVRLDLSGIAKGFAADAVADQLAAMGRRHALVEVGGELVGRGIRPDGEPWWVDVEDPPETSLAPIRIALHGIAVATSGSYMRGAHSLDGRTGRPATQVLSCTVVAACAMLADAWVTAITVAGVRDGLIMAEREGVAARLVTVEGVEHLTPALRNMISTSDR